MPLTGRVAPWLLLLLALTGCAGKHLAAPTLLEQSDWKRHFDAAGVTGTMVVQKDGSPDILVFDAKRAARPLLPASTFKILNTLIALQTGAVTGPDEVFAYDGVPRALAAWNKAMTLRQAFALSCVPVYQQIARRIGAQRMAWYVAACRYGNADISGGIDRFWLEGGLRISALGQIDFLARLDHHRQLPFSPATIDTLLDDVMVVEKTPDHTLLAKTGWTARVSPGVGWYVGLVRRGGETWYFALNCDIDRPGQLAAREAVARAILHEAGAL